MSLQFESFQGTVEAKFNKVMAHNQAVEVRLSRVEDKMKKYKEWMREKAAARSGSKQHRGRSMHRQEKENVPAEQTVASPEN